MDIKNKIIKLLSSQKEGFSEKHIFRVLNIKSDFDKKGCRLILERLSFEGKIFFDKRVSKYKITINSTGIKGKVSGNKRGYAFIIPEDENQPDIFIAPRNLHGAMHNDTVICRLVNGEKDKSDEGEIISILERGTDTIVGTYLASNGYGFVEPDDQRYSNDIFIASQNKLNAKDRQKVVVEITEYPQGNKNPEGKIAEVLGDSLDPATDILSIIRSYNLYEEFDSATVKAAKKASTVIDKAEIEKREDFRDLTIVTIDGEDAKDLDDAISIEKKGSLYELGVHIADVSYYVQENSPLDNEALKRGTSVYFPDRVLPMLPRELSNGICSLNPEEDRFSLSVIMTVNNEGKVTKSRVVNSVIKSKARMTYTSVQLILDNDKNECEKFSRLTEMFLTMKELADILISKRGRRGSIDFDLPEAKITLDEHGKIEDIKPYPRNMSNKIIEEFMILANETVAETFFKKEIPFVYRVHENPTEEKMYTFRKFIQVLGYSISESEDLNPLEFALLLDKLEGKPEYSVINKVMLRTMMKAKYSPTCSGHFGLASTFYCHFTSPIRRYPDLMIHRIIKAFLDGKDVKTDTMREKTANVSLISSEREKLADEAERDIDDYYKAKYMENHIGEIFNGIISGITEFGIYVELENTVEGMIRIDSLPDDIYEYFKEQFMLKGKNNVYKLSDKMTIKVESSNARARKIDFVPA